MEVIVNADDLGVSTTVDQATLNLMEVRRITSATCLANGPDIEDVAGKIFSIPKFHTTSFGAHLNLTEFRPITKISQLEPLLTEDGAFGRNNIRNTRIGSQLSEGIYVEFCAQIDKLYDLGIPITHIDSHHYVFSIPRLFPILKRIQMRYGIRKVRISRNIYGDCVLRNAKISHHELGVDPTHGDNPSGWLKKKKWIYNWVLRNYYKSTTTEGFSGFRLFYEYAKLKRMNHKTFEVNVHPANPYYHSSEEALLATEWWKDLPFPVRLISYHELR